VAQLEYSLGKYAAIRSKKKLHSSPLNDRQILSGGVARRECCHHADPSSRTIRQTCGVVCSPTMHLSSWHDDGTFRHPQDAFANRFGGDEMLNDPSNPIQDITITKWGLN